MCTCFHSSDRSLRLVCLESCSTVEWWESLVRRDTFQEGVVPDLRSGPGSSPGTRPSEESETSKAVCDESVIASDRRGAGKKLPWALRPIRQRPPWFVGLTPAQSVDPNLRPGPRRDLRGAGTKPRQRESPPTRDERGFPLNRGVSIPIQSVVEEPRVTKGPGDLRNVGAFRSQQDRRLSLFQTPTKEIESCIFH
jgi:hypothetical protein